MNNYNARPFRDEKGNIKSDEQVLRDGYKFVVEQELKTGKPSSLRPRFKAWLKGAVEHMDNGGSLDEYKQKTLQRTLDFGAIVQNTEKHNNKLSKQKVFDSKDLMIIKGVSK